MEGNYDDECANNQLWNYIKHKTSHSLKISTKDRAPWTRKVELSRKASRESSAISYRDS